MAKIKITDLPKDMSISEEELREIRGGRYGLYPRVPSGDLQQRLELGPAPRSPLESACAVSAGQ